MNEASAGKCSPHQRCENGWCVGVWPFHGSGRQLPCIRRWPGVLVVGWRWRGGYILCGDWVMAADGDGSGVVMVVMVFTWESMMKKIMAKTKICKWLYHVQIIWAIYSFMSRFVAQCVGAVCGFLPQFFFMSGVCGCCVWFPTKYKILFKPHRFEMKFIEPNVFFFNSVQSLMMGKQENGLSRKTVAGHCSRLATKINL
jgi:hypothetical protein